ncbi:MAG: MarR family transcriptional regulator, partial [Myxococcota bacterium]
VTVLLYLEAMGKRTLGTLLRHLIELLDGGVQTAYDELGLDYRPRFTPVVRTLMDGDAKSVREIAGEAGLTHSAASQTLMRMRREGLVEGAKQRSKGSFAHRLKI